MVLSVAAALLFALAISPWVGTLSDTLEISTQAIEAVDSTVEVIDEALVVLSDTLTDVDGVFIQTEKTLNDLTTVVLSTATLLNREIPAQVDAIQSAMDGLIDTANVVDGILGALSFIGVDYDPEVPLDEALIDVNEQLGELADSLSDDADQLVSMTVSIGRLNDEITETADSLKGLEVQIEESRRLIAGYRSTTGEAQLVVGRASERLIGQIWMMRVLGVALLLVLGVAFSVVWWVGRSLAIRSEVTDPG